jgi:hypothetical protein
MEETRNGGHAISVRGREKEPFGRQFYRNIRSAALSSLL